MLVLFSRFGYNEINITGLVAVLNTGFHGSYLRVKFLRTTQDRLPSLSFQTYLTSYSSEHSEHWYTDGGLARAVVLLSRRFWPREPRHNSIPTMSPRRSLLGTISRELAAA